MLRERLARREDLEPISVRGRAAGITTGACWSVAGVTLVWSAWYELTCPLGGPRGTSICAHTVGVGGLASDDLMPGWKLAVAALGLVLGLVLARWRRIPWPLGSALAVATVARATWYSIQMSVGLPSV